MADDKTVPEILTLARLCGIQPEFEDIFGVSHCVSLSTMEALLTAMGVPCATPGEVRDSLEDLQENLLRGLLPPVSVVDPESGGLVLKVIWPKPEVPSPLDLAGELTGEDGDAVPWQPRPDQLILQQAQENHHGYLLKLALPLPAGLADGYYDLSLRAQGRGPRGGGGHPAGGQSRPRLAAAGPGRRGTALGPEPPPLCLKEPPQLGHR